MVSRKKIYDDPFAFAGLRDYARGDPMKYINWKGHRPGGEDADQPPRVHPEPAGWSLLLDMEGGGRPPERGVSVRLCCALCQRLLEEGVSLAAYSNGTDAATGARWELEGLQGGGSQLYLKKRFACIQAGDGLEDVCRVLPEQPGERGPGGAPLLPAAAGAGGRPSPRRWARGRGVQVIPCRGERRELPAHKNVSLVWTEVVTMERVYQWLGASRQALLLRLLARVHWGLVGRHGCAWCSRNTCG